MELNICSVTKQYNKQVWGLRDISLQPIPGVLGLLGPNGAGKSTLMRILATITLPTSGTITWNGADIVKQPNDLRQSLGYLPQDFGVYPNLNAVEFLEYMAAMKGLNSHNARQRIYELLQMVNLTEAARRPLGGYSGGMKQRIGIAQALLNDPQLLIVDEPTVGLDPEERVRFRQLLSELSGDRLVILSTHIVSDVEATATSIAILARGQLVEYGTPDTILNKAEGKVWKWLAPTTDLAEIKKNFLLSGSILHGDLSQVRVVADERPNVDAEQVPPTLEDAYLICLKGGAQ
jgi:ABC-2 type transport system ATP-binding protein